MTKTIYLHIGTNKTGTTTIQAGLKQNQAELEARGYAYPCLSKKEVAHHNLIRELWKAPQFNASLCKLADIQTFVNQTHHNNVIISTENLTWATVEDLQKFATYLNGYQVKVVVYLRRQDQLLQSMWANRVKQGKLESTFDDWFDTILQEATSDTPSKGRYNPVHMLQYDTFIAKYASVFGEENIMVRAYERSYMNNNIFADFLQFIGMDETDWIPETTNHNITPSAKILEFVRKLSIRWDNSQTQKLAVIPWSILYYFKDLREFANSLGWNDQRLNLIDQAKYDQVMRVYGEGNDRVAKQYLGRDQLFREPFVDRPITSFTANDFTTEDLMPMMQEMTTKHLQLLKEYRKKAHIAQQPTKQNS